MQENNYSVYEHITPDGMYYFGVTTDVKQRWVCNGALYKTTSLQPYIDKYGWDNIQHQVLFENQTKENALWIEDFLIKTAREDDVCINKNRSGYITEDMDAYQREYKRDHREEYNAYQREYKRDHREEYNAYQREYQREYREDHREEYNTYQREYQMEYRKTHREESRTYMRNYMRKYYHRKKYQKQLNELGYIPLF